MRATSAATLAVTALASIASAGNVYIDNLCPFDAYMTTDQAPFQTAFRLPQQQTAATVPQLGPDSLSHDINVAVISDMSNAMAFSYSQNLNGNDYYSFNTTGGDPFAVEGFEALCGGNNPPNPAVRCEARPNGGCCQHAFTYAGEEATVGTNLFFTNNGADFTLRLCASDML